MSIAQILVSLLQVCSLVSIAEASCPYPSKSQISGIFQPLTAGNITAFFDHVQPNVTWTVEGTHPLAGTYHSRDAFYNGTILRLGELFSKKHPLKTTIGMVTGGCQDEWALVELSADGMLRNGLPFHNRYAWVCRFDLSGKIAQVRAYLDSELVARAVVSNEIPFHTFSDNRG